MGLTPIHKLLARIQWDQDFGEGDFEIGYYDRQVNGVQRVSFRSLSFPGGPGHRVFELLDEAGQLRRIPLHRIREVFRDGKLIWQREA